MSHLFSSHLAVSTTASRTIAARSLRRACVLLLTLASFTVLCTAASAETPPGVHGIVHDPLGAAVPNATVELLGRSGVLATTSSGADGGYSIALPGSGRFQLRVSAASFRATLTPASFFTADGTASMDLTLSNPTLSETVTVTATGTPMTLAQSAAPITVLTDAEFPYSPELQQPLRLVPGVQITQSGQTGGGSGLFLRGADSDATKVLIDGTPLNDIGGAVNFGTLATVGIARIEVQREPNSALYGSDALAGVVSFTSTRGATPLPQIVYAVDGGNFGFFRQEADLSGAHGRFDYFNGFARLNTSNSLAADAFHNATFAGNYGYIPRPGTDLRLTVRHVAANGGQPNAIALYGIPDSAGHSEHNVFLNAALNDQTKTRWHNLLEYGFERLRSQSSDYAPTGTLYTPAGSKYANGYIGAPVTLRGANGFQVSGQALFQYVGTYPNFFNDSTNRDFVYAQTDFHFNAHTSALGAFRYEDERGFLAGVTSGYLPPPVDHGNYSYTLQVAGDLHSRLFYTLGSGIEKNAVYGKALTPRASIAYYLVRPSAQRFWSGTKLHGSFGKGVKGPSVGQEDGSAYQDLQVAGTAGKYNIGPLGAEYSRSYDIGMEQQLGDGRARVNVTFFHNQFTNGFEYVPQAGLQQLGLSAANDPALQYGAYVNALAFRALGGEAEIELRLSRHVFARGGYTYLDARVQHSLSSDVLFKTFNNFFNFPTTQIGVYGPLDGARPFRRAPHTGFFSVVYTRSRLDTQLSGTLVGTRDDSTFLSDKNFDTSLLLPNRNLDGGYQRLELTSSYRLSKNITTYANLQNLLNEHYFEAFGYPALPFNLRGGLKFTLGGESWHPEFPHLH